jgi:hypothetical protein
LRVSDLLAQLRFLLGDSFLFSWVMIELVLAHQ